jgi:hypothetical protein
MVANTSSRVTTNHDAIRRWAEERGAKPVLAGKSDGKPACVRLEFPDSRDTSLREIGWEEWFQRFDKSKLALLYQQQTADGERSSFCEIVRREKADEVEQAVGGRGRSATRRGKPPESKAERLRPAGEGGRSAPAKKTPRSAGPGKIGPKTIRPRKPGATSGRGEMIGS